MNTNQHRFKLLLRAIGLAAAASLLAAPARAAVEFVTPVGGCTKVDQIGDGKDLSLQAGKNVRFEVWGSGVDVNPGVSGDDAAVNARILAGTARGGPQNAVGTCRYATGSVGVEVDSPGGTTQTLQRTLRFRMPMGDTSPLQIRVVPFPQPQWRFTGFQENPQYCLTKQLTPIVKDLQDKRIVITLPPGAAQDTSNCSVRLFTHISFPGGFVPDISRSFSVALTGLPNVFTLYGPTPLEFNPDWTPTGKSLTLESNIAGLRAVNAPLSSTMTVAMPNGRSDTLTVQVNPPPVTNAFTQAVICRNQATGTTINVNDNFECDIQLAHTPPAGGQRITFQAIDRLCVAAGSSAVSYSSVGGGGVFTAPPTGTFHRIPLRALGGTTSAGTPCANNTSPVAHTLKFWIGDRDIESGADFSQTQIRIRSP